MRNWIELNLIIFLVCCTSCNIFLQKNKIDDGSLMQNGQPQLDTLLCKIDFQDFFNKDTVSLIVEDSVIMKNEILTSNEIAGFTGVTFSIFKNDESSILVRRSRSKHWVLQSSSDLLNGKEVNFQLVVNGKRFNYTEVIEKNRFLGIGKLSGMNESTDWDIEVIQSDEKFMYY